MLTEAEQNRLIVGNMGLVSVVAADFRGGNVDFEDLLSIGREGLVKAARSYNPVLGNFGGWAAGAIRSEIFHALRNEASEWMPKESDELSPLDGDKLERIYEWSPWGDRGNAEAICERWRELYCTPEELFESYQEIKDKQERFAAAFISLNHIQRKLVRLVYLEKPALSLADAAREIGISYWRAVRGMRRALRIMREVIARMDRNINSVGKNANGHPSSNEAGLHGCAPEPA